MFDTVHVRGGKLWGKLMDLREKFITLNCEAVRDELTEDQKIVLNRALCLDVKNPKEIICFPSFRTIASEMGVTREWARQMFYRGLKKANIDPGVISEKKTKKDE